MVRRKMTREKGNTYATKMLFLILLETKESLKTGTDIGNV
jgi:hypothetical protein